MKLRFSMTSLIRDVVARVVAEVASCGRLEGDICSIVESRINTSDYRRAIFSTPTAKQSCLVSTRVVASKEHVRRRKIFFAIDRYFCVAVMIFLDRTMGVQQGLSHEARCDSSS